RRSTKEMSEGDAKKRLMDAAMAYVRQGKTPTTRELAASAGVNISAISYYFQGKDNLVAEALDQAARTDIDVWVAEHLDPGRPAPERLRTFCRFLARVHRNFWMFSHAQLQGVVLPGRPEYATRRACQELRAMCSELEGVRLKEARVKAASLMASLHYLSIFHSQFEDMTRISVGDEDALYAYVDDLLASHGIDTQRG
ncbi:MAG: TetR family transcriptional regulator, partial [Myxococcota bacterium]